jgi:hypothetical protein
MMMTSTSMMLMMAKMKWMDNAGLPIGIEQGAKLRSHHRWSFSSSMTTPPLAK